MEILKERVYQLYDTNYSLSLEQYNQLIKDCANKYEMAAVVFIYDHMKENNITPNDYTYKLINNLHSKTVLQNNAIYIKNQNVGKLDPRRRIHKIMKGHNYSSNYQNALLHLEKVKEYLQKKPNIKSYPRIKMAKDISKNCSISFNDARYIITNLKRTKFLVKTPIKIDDFSKILAIHNETKNKVFKQTNITDFFSRKS